MGILWSGEVDVYWRSDAHFAMESGTYCVICGNTFDLQGDVYNENPKDPRFQWLYHFRILGNSEDMNVHRLTSGHSKPVNTSKIRGIFLSERAKFTNIGHYYFLLKDQSGTEDIEYNALWYTRHAENTLFPLHEACLDISCRTLDHRRSRQEPAHPEPALKVLYRFLNERFLYRHRNSEEYDPTTQDMFELRHRSKLYGPRSIIAMNKLEWRSGEQYRFYANPIEVPGLNSMIFDIICGTSVSKPVEITPLATAQEPHGIERLPPETLDAICEYLPTRTVIKFYRTSKTIALKLQLDNAFWRKTLLTGKLHPHLWGIDFKKIEKVRRKSNIKLSIDDLCWKSVAKLLATKQFPVTERDARLDNMPLGFWNRCRIWHNMERALDLDYIDRLDYHIRSDSGIHFRI